MDVLIVTVLASLALVVVALLFLAQRVKQGDMEHGDRLSLLPLEDDAPPEDGPEGPDDDPKQTTPKHRRHHAGDG